MGWIIRKWDSLSFNCPDNACYFCIAGEFLQEHRRVLDSRLQPVLMGILDARARSREELESKLFRYVHMYHSDCPFL